MDLLVVLANFVARSVQDFQSQRAGFDLPFSLKGSSTRGVSERVNKNAQLPFHLPPAADEFPGAFSIARVLRERN